MLTVQEIEKCLPAHFKKQADQNLADLVNNLISDPDIAETYRENFISYTSVLTDGKYKIENYIHAVAYVGYKHMGYSNKEAYLRTFPARHAALVSQGKTEKEISSYVSAYHKNKLVNAILEQSLIPMWLANQDAYQKAINTQVLLMTTSQSDLVKTQAANSILTHLAKPKDAVAKVSIEVNDSLGLNELRATLASLAAKQKELIESGVTTKEIAEQNIIDVEPRKIE